MTPSSFKRLGARLYDAPYLLLTVTAFLWSSNIVLGRFIAGEIPPVTLACLRWAIAALAILPFVWKPLRSEWRIVLRHLPVLGVLSAAGVASYNAMSYYGLQYTQALNGLLVQSISPLLIALWSLILFRDRLKLGQSVGILVSLLGVLVIISRGDLDILLHLKPNRGDVWILAALVIYCFYAAILRIRPALSSAVFLFAIMALGAVLLAPFAIVEARSGFTLSMDLRSLSVILYVSLFPALLAYFFFNRGVELIGANRAAPFFHLMPVFGSVLAILVLGERFEWYHGLGYALVLAGIVTATRAGRAPPQPEV